MNESTEREKVLSPFEQEEDFKYYTDEVQKFSQLLQKDPGYAYQRSGLTLLYSLKGKEMIRELEKFGWKAENAQDLFNLGAIKSEEGDHKGALKYYEKAVELEEDHWAGYYNLALTHKELGNKNEAGDSIRKCIQILEEKQDLFPWEKEDLKSAKKFVEGM